MPNFAGRSGGGDGTGAVNNIGGGGDDGSTAVGNNGIGSAASAKTDKREETSWWPHSNWGAYAGHGGRGMPPDVARTDVLPAKLRYMYM